MLHEDNRLGPAAQVATGLNVSADLPSSLEPLDELSLDVSIEDLSRVQADARLRQILSDQGFAGDDYEVFEDALARYGYQLMWAWLSKDYIFTRCREFNIYLTPAPVARDELQDLVQDVVWGALETFKQKGLIKGRWQPERGASMRTYFTRGLCHEFANWWRKHLRGVANHAVASFDDVRLDRESRDPGPEQTAIMRDEIRRGLADIGHERARFAIALRADGYSHQEIAELIGISVRAVEGYFRRHAKRLACRGGAR